MAAKNKIIFVTPWYGQFAGGFEVAFRNYAELLTKLEWEVEIFTTCCKDPYSPWDQDFYQQGEYQNNQVKVRRFKTNKNLENYYAALQAAQQGSAPISAQYNFFSYGISSDDLVAELSKAEADVPIICGPYFHALTYLVIKHYPQRIFLMSAFHNEPEFLWQPVGEMIANAKGLLFGTEEEKDLAIAHYGQLNQRKLIEASVIGVPMMTTLELGNKTSQLTSNKACQSIPEYRLPSNYFIYIGRKEIGKGLDRLISWYQNHINERIKNEQKVYPLVFIGGGNSALIPNNRYFIDLNFVSAQRKYRLLAKATALINLSAYESFSLVLMEAWLCRIPVVVYGKCEVTKNHCLRSNGGFSVTQQNEFCKTLNYLLDSQDKKVYGENGKAYVLKNYSLFNVINNFIMAIS